MFTGKGGVGKTTLAAATALYFSLRGPTLLVSTDPTGSLGQIFGRNLQERKQEIYPGLSVLELTREKVLALWREKFADDIYTVVSSLFPVGREIIDYIEGAPGIETEFMLDYLLTALKRGDHRYLIWDTAPTASILNLLKVQLLFYAHLSQAQRLYLRLKGLFQGADPLSLIKQWQTLTAEIIHMLKTDTAAWVVAHPEQLPVREALSLSQALDDFGLEVKGIILNKVLDAEVCPDCLFLEEKRKYQQFWLETLCKETTYPVKVIPEIVGDLHNPEVLLSLAQMFLTEGT